ncbi:hypothetical protein [Glycomyces salinus]|uniref:hypothetical protein n=1 Tax=Glycomyces salinus TaxID=980294 RepID=UPI0018EE0DBE|nr:hypothetical protein [Glycomyces salinus]
MADDWHENIVNLIQDQPRFAAELLRAADGEDYGDIAVSNAERSANALGSKATTERRADAVSALTLEFSEVDRLLVITEVQGKWSEEKNRRLLGYVSRAFEDNPDSEVELLMICRTDALARKFKQGIRVNRRWQLAPLTLSPGDLLPYRDPDDPGATPESAVLRVLLNPSPDDPESVIRTVDDLLGTIEPEVAIDYINMIADCLDENARVILESLMRTKPRPYRYHSEWTDQLRREGRQEGRQEGRLQEAREALVDVCIARSIVLGEAERALIEQCGDLDRLREWRSRARSAKHLADIFAV